MSLEGFNSAVALARVAALERRVFELQELVLLMHKHAIYDNDQHTVTSMRGWHTQSSRDVVDEKAEELDR